MWYNILEKFYGDFEPLLDVAFKNMSKDAPSETGEVCPECGKPLVIRNGKYGKFVACSAYPECKYIQKEEKKIVEICDCPKCGHKIVEKKTKRGKVFYGCSNYPKCDFALWDKPTGEKCEYCGGLMVEKKTGTVCSDCGK